MISGYASMVRQLRAFMEKSALPWQGVHFVNETDTDGRVFLNPRRLEVWFSYDNQKVDINIQLPNDENIDGEGLPLGKLAGRKNGKVVKGPLDERTWDEIVAMIRGNDA